LYTGTQGRRHSKQTEHTCSNDNGDASCQELAQWLCQALDNLAKAAFLVAAVGHGCYDTITIVVVLLDEKDPKDTKKKKKRFDSSEYCTGTTETSQNYV
jgi:HrpA-like RNA helicase